MIIELHLSEVPSERLLELNQNLKNLGYNLPLDKVRYLGSFLIGTQTLPKHESIDPEIFVKTVIESAIESDFDPSILWGLQEVWQKGIS